MNYLPEDGIADWVAIETAVDGTREVALTKSEAFTAAQIMIECGCEFDVIAARLAITRLELRELLRAAHKVEGPARKRVRKPRTAEQNARAAAKMREYRARAKA